MCLGFLWRGWVGAGHQKRREFVYVLAGAILLAGVVVVTITLLVMCVNKKVKQDQYGVVVNQYTMKLSDPLEQGTYTLLPGDDLQLISRVVFDSGIARVACLSADAIQLSLTLSIQVQYVMEFIIPHVYLEYGGEKNFMQYVRLQIEDAIITTCGQFTAERYYTERGQIETAMFQATDAATVRATPALEVLFLQLKNIAFPDDFASAITEKQLVQQREVTVMNERLSRLIAANTTYLASKQEAQVILIQANNTALVNRNQAEVDRTIELTRWSKLADAYLTIKQHLNLNTTGLLQYMRNQLIGKSKSPVVALQ